MSDRWQASRYVSVGRQNQGIIFNWYSDNILTNAETHDLIKHFEKI